MRYSRTALMELTHRYSNVLKKCALINATILMSAVFATPVMATPADVDTWADLQTALTTGSDIRATASMTPSGVLTVTSKTNTLDLNAKDLNAGGTSAGTSGLIFNGGSLTLTGGGTFAGFNNPDTDPSSVNGAEYGALDLRGGATLTMTGGNWVFSENTSGLGALNTYNAGLDANVDTIFFSNNQSNSQGAGLRHDVTTTASSPVARITANTIQVLNNSFVEAEGAVAGSGAGVLNSRGRMELLGSTNIFSGNTMNAVISSSRTYKVGGGAVANQSGEAGGNTFDATMIIGKDTSSQNGFTLNTSSTNGGAIMNRALRKYDPNNSLVLKDNDGSAYLTINGTTAFFGNQAWGTNTSTFLTGNGGAIYNILIDEVGGENPLTADITINGDTGFYTNTAAYAGGAIYNTGDITLNGKAHFGDEDASTGNHAVYGGAIFNDMGGTITFNDKATFTNNYTADEDGGAIENGGGTLLFNGEAKFTANSAGNVGGALDNYDEGSVTFGGATIFRENSAANVGGAIANTETILFKDTAQFDENTALSAGAIENFEGDITFEKAATFTGNSATDGDGGAIYNADGTITFENTATFTGNIADGSGVRGGAIANYEGTLIFEDTATFTGNSAKTKGGALFTQGTYSYDDEGVHFSENVIFNGDATFTGNTAGDEESHTSGDGGAVVNTTNMTFGGNATFTANKAIGGGCGGAVYHTNQSGQTGVLTFDGTADFTGNTAGNMGGALYTLGEVNFAKAATFTGNEAVYGGALTVVNGGARVTFEDDVEFTGNSASSEGGAIYHYGDTLTFNKGVTFASNTDETGSNDITTSSNAITIFNGETVLDGGIYNHRAAAQVIFGDASELSIGEATSLTNGIIEFKEGSKLRSVLNNTTALVQADGEDTFLKGSTSLVVLGDTREGLFTMYGEGVDASDFAMTLDDNMLYNIMDNQDGTFEVALKSSEELAEEFEEAGVGAQEAETLAAVAEYAGDNEVLNSISEALQTGDFADAGQAAKELAPTNSQAVMGIAQGINSLLSNVAAKRVAAVGRAGGDTFKGGAVWAEGLYNYAKQDSSASTDGFKADTAGLAMGADGKINDATTVGFGYAYTQTDADSVGRDMDVDGHNFFIYGSYQPSAWYVNAMLSYGFSEYKEKKSPAGVAMKSKYDVNTYAANVMTGYDMGNGFTPESGLRYILVDQDAYNDGAQRISSKNNDVLTAVMGVKYAADVKTAGWTFTPTARFAVTYDLLSSNSKANVSIIDGGSYQITGKRLNRLGFEAGVGIGTSVDNWDFTLEYNGGFRKDFQNHSGMLKAKYNF